ncbi:fasciclin domain-containing protein, partial [Verrucomicrobia bacterium]|nr:fasciclin domain-containing protein [Verrucomicrobiota bacterium]
NILTYHVVPGKVMAKDVKTSMVKTANGSKVSITVSDKGVKVDNAKVVKTDVVASNGVIHVIDAVILPKS